MAWTSPPTWSDGNVLTAAQLNILRDDLNETAVAKASAAGQYFCSTGANALAARVPTTAAVDDLDTTTGTSFADIATVGPSVTVTTGTQALVCMHSRMANSTGGSICSVGFTVAGATTIAGADEWRIAFESSAANDNIWTSGVFIRGALTPGSNTFKMVYKVNAGTGSFGDRKLTILPF